MPAMRARRFAWMAAASTLGFMVGPLLGGWLIGTTVILPSGAIANGFFSTPFFTAAAAGALV